MVQAFVEPEPGLMEVVGWELATMDAEMEREIAATLRRMGYRPNKKSRPCTMVQAFVEPQPDLPKVMGWELHPMDAEMERSIADTLARVHAETTEGRTY
jgi:hypothetical protein